MQINLPCSSGLESWSQGISRCSSQSLGLGTLESWSGSWSSISHMTIWATSVLRKQLIKPTMFITTLCSHVPVKLKTTRPAWELNFFPRRAKKHCSQVSTQLQKGFVHNCTYQTQIAENYKQITSTVYSIHTLISKTSRMACITRLFCRISTVEWCMSSAIQHIS